MFNRSRIQQEQTGGTEEEIQNLCSLRCLLSRSFRHLLFLRSLCVLLLPLSPIHAASPLFEKDFLDGPSVEDVIANKIVPGGTAPECVRAAIAILQNRLDKLTTKTGAKP